MLNKNKNNYKLLGMAVMQKNIQIAYKDSI